MADRFDAFDPYGAAPEPAPEPAAARETSGRQLAPIGQRPAQRGDQRPQRGDQAGETSGPGPGDRMGAALGGLLGDGRDALQRLGLLAALRAAWRRLVDRVDALTSDATWRQWRATVQALADRSPTINRARLVRDWVDNAARDRLGLRRCWSASWPRVARAMAETSGRS